MKKDTSRLRVLANLLPSTPLSARQIALRTGLGATNVRKRLNELKKAGLARDDAPVNPLFAREKLWLITEEGMKIKSG